MCSSERSSEDEQLLTKQKGKAQHTHTNVMPKIIHRKKKICILVQGKMTEHMLLSLPLQNLIGITEEM